MLFFAEIAAGNLTRTGGGSASTFVWCPVKRRNALTLKVKSGGVRSNHAFEFSTDGSA